MHRLAQRLLPSTLRRTLQRPLSSEPPSKKIPAEASVSLSDPLPGLPKAVYISNEKKKHEARTTTLSNGLRVASEPLFGQYCTIGACIDSGSRYEVAYPSGVCHFLEKFAFCSTEKFKDRDEILKRLEKNGGIIDCQSTRDTFLYASSVDVRGQSAAVEIIADAVLRPLIQDSELEDARMAIEYEIEDAQLNPMQENIMLEMIHAAAFSNNTVGLPKMCPIENVQSFNRQTLMNYLSNYHTPDRIVIAGVGVDHDKLVEDCQRYFVDEPSIWEKEGYKPQKQVDKSVAQYTGGCLTLDKDLSNASLGPTPMPELAHLTIALESVAHNHPDFLAFCVLNMMMGGGGSFSAGGPGKGMYTRLYTHVMNRYHWVYNCTAYNHAYADAGILCISGSAPPQQLDELAQVMVHELTQLSHGLITDTEFNRAQTQLKSMLLMNLESRPVIFEDLARQVLAYGERKRPEFYIEEINKVTIDDIHRISKRMLATKPAIASIGTLLNLPKYSEFELGLLDRTGKMPVKRKFSFFR